MNELQIFSNPEFGAVRALVIDDEPWAVGKDVATALGYKDTYGALKKHIDPEDKQNCQNNSFETPRGMTIINESGLYSLILSSKLPGAKRFKRWVTSEILPSLRKTGRYEMPQEAPDSPEALPAPRGLEPSDYIRAASIIANCQKGRLPAVITLLTRSGLDMSDLETYGKPPEERVDSMSSEEAQQIEDFVAQLVPRDWMSWSLARRRAYWAGEVTCDPKDLRRRDRIAAIEVWCELYNKPPKDSNSRYIRGINEVLASLPGWRKRTVRVGACYGPTHGFVRDD